MLHVLYIRVQVPLRVSVVFADVSPEFEGLFFVCSWWLHGCYVVVKSCSSHVIRFGKSFDLVLMFCVRGLIV